MNGFWYTVLVRFSGLFGPWLFAVVSRVIACGYFLFSPRVAESRRFYGALYPGRSRLYHLWCTFLQYQNFTTIHFDRFLKKTVPMTFTSEGWGKLEEVIGSRGGVLLMSHLGNWEVGASLLKDLRSDLRLLLYMGIKEKEGVEKLQKEGLRRSGVTIVGVGQEDNAPFSAVAGISMLRSGGLVSMAGDVVWRRDQRRVEVRFLGRKAYLPEAPFVFALLSGAPLFPFFVFRSGRNQYSFVVRGPIPLEPRSRGERAESIAMAAQAYADFLEEALRRHPFEWYHFDRFIHCEASDPPAAASQP